MEEGDSGITVLPHTNLHFSSAMQFKSNLVIIKKSFSPQDTHNLGKYVAKEVEKRRISTIALVGELGSGKTVFVRGVVEGLGGDPDEVSSPTFVLMQVYSGRDLLIYHFDCYRVGSVQELMELGWNELLLKKNAVLVVEWADKIREILPPDTVWVNIEHYHSTERMIEISFPGSLVE